MLAEQHFLFVSKSVPDFCCFVPPSKVVDILYRVRYNIHMQRACRKRFTPGKDLHMSDFEMLSIILMVLGLVLMGNQKGDNRQAATNGGYFNS